MEKVGKGSKSPDRKLKAVRLKRENQQQKTLNCKKAAEGNGISIQRGQSKASVTPKEKETSSQRLKRSTIII